MLDKYDYISIINQFILIQFLPFEECSDCSAVGFVRYVFCILCADFLTTENLHGIRFFNFD